MGRPPEEARRPSPEAGSGASLGGAGPSGHPTYPIGFPRRPGCDPDAPYLWWAGPDWAPPLEPTPSLVLRRRRGVTPPREGRPPSRQIKRWVSLGSAAPWRWPRPVPAGMGLWVALWVLLYLPRALQGQNLHSRAAPTSVLQFLKDSKAGPGRDGRCPPARVRSQPSQLSGHPCHGDPWPPAAENPRLFVVPTSPCGVVGNVSVPPCTEAPGPASQVPAGLRALSAPAGMNPTPGAASTPAYPQPLQFQGEWFVLGLAGNTHTVADRSPLSPFHRATFTLNKNNRLGSGIRHVP